MELAGLEGNRMFWRIKNVKIIMNVIVGHMSNGMC